MLSTRFMFSPWLYYEWTWDQWCIVERKFADRQCRGLYNTIWTGKDWIYMTQPCGQAWKNADNMAMNVGVDYGCDLAELKSKHRTGDYTGPLMVLRDC